MQGFQIQAQGMDGEALLNEGTALENLSHLHS
jgi:hypothetical protein